jgi:mannose-6-phosphate isomerase-like protein (cupin superfamily)
MTHVITKSQSIHHSRSGVDGHYYRLPAVQNGTTVAYAEFTGEHGERTIGDRERIYYVLEGSAKFMINKEEFVANQGDLVTIPQKATYNLWPLSPLLKVLLYMELISF